MQRLRGGHEIITPDRLAGKQPREISSRAEDRSPRISEGMGADLSDSVRPQEIEELPDWRR